MNDLANLEEPKETPVIELVLSSASSPAAYLLL